MVQLLFSFPASLRVANAVACGFFQEVFLAPCAGIDPRESRQTF
jgi:hypothetical protein